MCRYAWLPRKCGYRTDRQTRMDGWMDKQTDARHSDPYVPVCFVGDTKMSYWPLLMVFRCFLYQLVCVWRWTVVRTSQGVPRSTSSSQLDWENEIWKWWRGIRCDRRLGIHPSFATWLYNQINVDFKATGEQNYYSMHDYKISRFSTIIIIIIVPN